MYCVLRTAYCVLCTVPYNLMLQNTVSRAATSKRFGLSLVALPQFPFEALSI